MAEEKENDKKTAPEKIPDFVKWFSELNKDSGSIAGGKVQTLLKSTI